jgi:hypothetical protein
MPLITSSLIRQDVQIGHSIQVLRLQLYTLLCPPDTCCLFHQFRSPTSDHFHHISREVQSMKLLTILLSFPFSFIQILFQNLVLNIFFLFRQCSLKPSGIDITCRSTYTDISCLSLYWKLMAANFNWTRYIEPVNKCPARKELGSAMLCLHKSVTEPSVRSVTFPFTFIFLPKSWWSYSFPDGFRSKYFSNVPFAPNATYAILCNASYLIYEWMLF